MLFIDNDSECRPSDSKESVQRAFLATLFDQYRGALLRHVRRLSGSPDDAADLVQDTYLRVMDRISVARCEGEARSYLFRTATNLARDHHRRQKFRAHAPLDLETADNGCADLETPDRILCTNQTAEALQAAILAMPEGPRAVFLLARSRELSYEGIAQRLGIGRRTVERRVAEAMAFLAVRLRDAA